MTKYPRQLLAFKRPRTVWSAIIFSLIALAFGIGSSSHSLPANNAGINQIQTPTPSLVVRSGFSAVTKVVDGDTIDVTIGDKKETVRFIGIDTPEVHDPRKPVQCFGKEAWDKAKVLLEGKQVRLERDVSQSDRDKYNRLLRYVFLEDGTNVNKLLVSEGYAHEYTYNIPYLYQSDFQQAEREAMQQKRGLWADGVCVSSTPTNQI